MSESLSAETGDAAESRREARERRLRYDDRIDLDTQVSSREAAVLMGRSLKLLAQARGLFAAKFLFSFGFMGSALLLPWIGKIITDNVLLQRPFGDTDVPYPPFMDPIIALVDGMAPMEIMLTLAVLLMLMLLAFGTRAAASRRSVCSAAPMPPPGRERDQRGEQWRGRPVGDRRIHGQRPPDATPREHLANEAFRAADTPADDDP